MYEPLLKHLESKIVVKPFDHNETSTIRTYEFFVSRGLPSSNWQSEWKSISEYEDLALVLSKSDVRKAPYVELTLQKGSSVTSDESPSDEQKEVVREVMDFFQSTSVADIANRFRTLTVFGGPGTGKTFTLRMLSKSAKDIAIVHYCMIQHNQVQNVPSVQTTTLAKFIMSVLHMDLGTYRRFNDILESTTIATLNEKTTKSKLKYSSKPFDNLFKNPSGSGVKENVLFFFDQVPKEDAPILRLVQLIFKHYLSLEHNRDRRVLLVICFDGDIDKENRSICNVTYQFRNSWRNYDPGYSQFLKNFKQAEWPECIEIMRKSLADKLETREIKFEYPVETLKTLPLPQLKNGQFTNSKNMKRWCNENLTKFRQFSFFSYTNMEAHFMNLSTFLAACVTFRDYYYSLPENDQGLAITQLLDHYQPCLASIGRHNESDDNKVSPGKKYLCYLPLVIGMTYKILPIVNPSQNTSKCGRTVQLLAILNRSGTTTTTMKMKIKGSEDDHLPRLLVIDNLGKFFLVHVSYFRMNLFSEKKMKGNNKLYGFPLQMISGDTVHNSKGLTVDNDLYASLGNCSAKLLHTILTRTKTEDQIKGINLPN